MSTPPFVSANHARDQPKLGRNLNKHMSLVLCGLATAGMYGLLKRRAAASDKVYQQVLVNEIKRDVMKTVDSAIAHAEKDLKRAAACFELVVENMSEERRIELFKSILASSKYFRGSADHHHKNCIVPVPISANAAIFVSAPFLSKHFSTQIQISQVLHM